MIKQPAIIQTQNSITIVFDKPVTINRDHPNFLKARQSIQEKEWEVLKSIADIKESVKKYSDGLCEIKGDKIFYNGEEVHNSIVDRIFQFMNEDMPWEPLLKFLNNLMSNPSFRARKELYNFLEHENLPVTEDGYFLAYKSVNSNYTDIWSGTMDNSIGNIVEMSRPSVDDDCSVGCSAGLHAGSLDYVNMYGCSGSVKVIVKINPRDVVSVPAEDSRKLRCCRYEVVSSFTSELTSSCYNDSAEPVSATNNSNLHRYDERFEDDWDWID
jgi:hypothetical protein